jgi:hypothetical protein
MSGIVRVGQCNYINGKRVDSSYKNIPDLKTVMKNLDFQGLTFIMYISIFIHSFLHLSQLEI